MSFNNKVVLVTGASQGIGAAIAIKHAEEGAKVAVVGRNREKLADVVKKCGNSALAIAADVTKEEECKRIINETVARFGKIDVLINNAGIIDKVSIEEDRALESFDKIMNTNVRSVVCLTNLAVPHLIKTKGNIVNISSIASMSVKAGKGGFAYSASKAAVDHFGRCIALDLAPYGIRVNTINPGPVKTDILGNSGMSDDNDDTPWEGMRQMTLLKRVSEPKEIAELAAFLSSDKAVGVTGSAYALDNGILLGDGFLEV